MLKNISLVKQYKFNDNIVAKCCVCFSNQLNELYKQIPGAQKVQKTSFR